MERPQHISVAGCLSKLWRKGLPAGAIWGPVESMGVPDVASAHPAITDEFCKLPEISDHEVVYGNILTLSGLGRVL